MKSKIFAWIFLFLFISVFFSSYKAQSSSGTFIANKPAAHPQEPPVKKPKDDYLSKYLGRNTKPLGLKEDFVLKKLLNESLVKWAIRAEKRHILN